MSMDNIEIKIISSDNWREALELSVYDEQQKYVASVHPPAAIALAKAYIRPGGKMVEPYGIYYQRKMVGFFNLHYTPGSEEDYWLFHFFIDKRFQRNGWGSKALNELISHIKQTNPSSKRLRLTVHSENEAGRLFYLKFGFSADNILTFDEPTFSISI
jgi:diamine N-acetyltransferase